MKYRMVEEPQFEPVTLAQLKAQLRLDGDYDDALLQRKLASARDYVERFLGQTLRATTYDGFLPRFPPREIRLPIGPLRSVEAITYRDAQGAERTLDPARYLVDDVNDPGQILPLDGRPWPATAALPNAVRVRFIAGMMSAEAGGLPEALIEAILQLAAWWYDHRDAAILDGSVREAPFGVAELLREHRGWSFG